MIEHTKSIGSYESHLLAQKAVEALHRHGLDPARATIVDGGPRTGERVTGYYNLPQRALSWGKYGAFWGGVWGLAFSVWLFWVPGVGPLLVTIPVVIGAAALGTLGALAASLYSLSIPRNSVLHYEAGPQRGTHVVLFEGSTSEIQRAQQVLDSANSLAAVLNMPVLEASTTVRQMY